MTKNLFTATRIHVRLVLNLQVMILQSSVDMLKWAIKYKTVLSSFCLQRGKICI